MTRRPSFQSIALVSLYVNLTGFALWRVSELSSTWARPYWGMTFVIVGALALRLTATVTDPKLERECLVAMLAALLESGLTQKEAYMLLGYSKGQWSDICAGRLHTPSHTRMLNLPWRFWQLYLPKLAHVLVQHKVNDLTGDVQVRRSA